MSETHIDLRELRVHGIGTRERLFHWNQAPYVLSAFGIEAIGIVEARAGYEWVRIDPQQPIIRYTISGEGEVLVGGQWIPSGPGSAYLMPVHAAHGYRAVGGGVWRGCWIIGQDPQLVNLHHPMVISAAGDRFWHAVNGALEEQGNGASPERLGRWIHLIRAYAEELGNPGCQPRNRLQSLWTAVTRDLAREWSVPAMADMMFMSCETLRRTCLRETGLTPKAKVLDIRMRTAASLLQTYEMPIEHVAQLVGYANAFAFSVAFKRWSGTPPSIYRG